MARGTMHATKDEASRRRRNAPTHAETVLTHDDVLRGPELDDAADAPAGEWHPMTVRWWNTWRASAQAQTFEDTDWMRLAILAPIMDGYVRRPSAAALSEIRMNEERLGATVVDRMRARMKIERRDGAAPVAPVVSIVQTRDDIAARLKREQ